MSIYRHSKQEVADYHARTEMNQSSLKVIAIEGIQSFLQKQEELLQTEEWYSEKEYFKIGSAVDHYLSYGEDDFRKSYHFSSMLDTPTGAVLAITKKVFDRMLAEKDGQANRIEAFEIYKEEIYNTCNEFEYYANRAKPSWENDTRIDTLIKGGAAAYFGELVESEGKTVISEMEANTAVLIAETFLTHLYTKDLFVDGPEIDIIFQMPLFFEYKGIACKALPDEIRIDHARKIIFPIDFKTHGQDILSFNQAVRARRYDFQGAFYTLAIQLCINQLSAKIGKDLSKYSIANFGFVANSTKNPDTPLKFPLSDKAILQGRYGDGKFIKGFEFGITRFKLWQEYGFSVEQRFLETNGTVFIDEFFEYSVNV